ncbi:DUF4157 domain-containing protein [Moorena sp. SIO3E8]|uniref:eCIS core domain-containing protein n=2 Tax=unclassified Moorena TaxID=2683338 RepID=UPI0025DEB267|nr:DUF4157 domain-containing protein [Moorena sp. SIO3E8]
MGNLRQSQTRKAQDRDQSIVSGSRKPTYHPIEELQGIIGNQALGQLIKSQPNKYGQVHRTQDPLLNSVSPVSGQSIQRMPMFRGLSHELRGNWQQGNLVQAKLTIGEAGDKYELEADRVASEDVDRINAPIPNKTGLPDKLKAGVENLSGYSLDDVRVNYNSPKPAQIQALAYTQGKTIEVGPGQERHLPHEAWHVVQQMQGRVKGTTQTKGIMVNDEKSLEQEADLMGRRAVTQAEVPKPALKKTNPQHRLSTLAHQTSSIQCMKPTDPIRNDVGIVTFDQYLDNLVYVLNEVFDSLREIDETQLIKKIINELGILPMMLISRVRSMKSWKEFARKQLPDVKKVFEKGLNLVSLQAEEENYSFQKSGQLAKALEKLYRLHIYMEGIVTLPERQKQSDLELPETGKSTKLKEGVAKIAGSNVVAAADTAQTGTGVASGGIGLLEAASEGITGPAAALASSTPSFTLGGISVGFGLLGTLVAYKNRKDARKSKAQIKSLEDRYTELKGSTFTTAAYTNKKAGSKVARSSNDMISGSSATGAGAAGLTAAGFTVAGLGAATATGIGASVVGVIVGLGALGLLGYRIFKRIRHKQPSYIEKELIAMWNDSSQRQFAEYIIKEHLDMSITQPPDEKELKRAIEQKNENIRLWAAKKIVEESINGSPLDRAYAEALIGSLGVDPNIPDTDKLM